MFRVHALVNSAVPSGLDATKLHCDLTASIVITDVYKLEGHIRCTADKTCRIDHKKLLSVRCFSMFSAT
ncbi:hypothetical protein K9N50_07735 [bacterium]|nr:hypothetical protein [bacterium]